MAKARGQTPNLYHNKDQASVTEYPRVLNNSGKKDELNHWSKIRDECSEVLKAIPPTKPLEWIRSDARPTVPPRERGRGKFNPRDFDAYPYALMESDLYDPTGADFEWPPDGTKLSDFGVYMAVRHLRKDIRRHKYPADFESDGHIRPTRVPYGPTVGLRAHGATWFPVYAGYYILCGGDYVHQAMWLLRPFKDFKRSPAQYPHDRFLAGLVTGEVKEYHIKTTKGDTSNIRDLQYINRANDDVHSWDGTWLCVKHNQLDCIVIRDTDRYIQFPDLSATPASVPVLEKFKNNLDIPTSTLPCRYQPTKILKRANIGGSSQGKYTGPLFEQNDTGEDESPAAPLSQTNNPNLAFFLGLGSRGFRPINQVLQAELATTGSIPAISPGEPPAPTQPVISEPVTASSEPLIPVPVGSTPATNTIANPVPHPELTTTGSVPALSPGEPNPNPEPPAPTQTEPATADSGVEPLNPEPPVPAQTEPAIPIPEKPMTVEPAITNSELPTQTLLSDSITTSVAPTSNTCLPREGPSQLPLIQRYSPTPNHQLMFDEFLNQDFDNLYSPTPSRRRTLSNLNLPERRPELSGSNLPQTSDTEAEENLDNHSTTGSQIELYNPTRSVGTQTGSQLLDYAYLSRTLCSLKRKRSFCDDTDREVENIIRRL